MTRASSTLLLDARLWTPGCPDAGEPRPLLVRDGRIAWVGEPGAEVEVPWDLRSDSRDEGGSASEGDRPGRPVRGATGRTMAIPTVEVIEVGGGLVTPAFVDAHAHVTMTGEALAGLDLSSATSPQEALAHIAAVAASRPGEPVYAHSWDETVWGPARPFTADEIEHAAPGTLVYALRVDAHVGVASHSLLRRCGASGAPGDLGEGLVTREAHHRVRDLWATLATDETRQRWVELALDAAARAGIGLVHECAAPHIGTEADLQRVLAAGGEAARPRVVGYWGQLVEESEEAEELAARLGVRGLAGDLNVDGSFGARTACLLEPYADEPGHHGFAYLTAEQVGAHVAACTWAGVQAGFHVIGDGGLARVLEGFALAAQTVGARAVRHVRHRLEHVEMCTPEQAAQLARLGVTASMQPAFESAWGGAERMYAQRLGAPRAATTNAWGSHLNAGVPVAFGSDSPVTAFDPWGAVRACVEPLHEGQRLAAHEAVACHTEAGWRAAGYREDDPSRGGRVEIGAPADLVLWDTDHLPGTREEFVAPLARRTIVRGRTIFDREALA